MKTTILILLILIETFVSGQSNRNFKHIDTLKIIKTRHIPDHKISYLNEDYEFQFSKTVCLKVIDTMLKTLESELNDNGFYSKEYQLKDINKYKIVRNYFKEQDYIKLKKPFFDDKVANTLELTDSLFAYIAPAMLDAGMFKLYINGKSEKRIIKSEVCCGNCTLITISYILESGKEVWYSTYIGSMD